MTVEHRLDASGDAVRVGIFDRDHPPVLTIESGDIVETQTLNHWADGVTPESTMEDLFQLRNERYPEVGPHTLTGPIAVRGAKVGQVLKVDILELQPRTHGFNLHYPGEFGTGLLYEDFADGQLRHYELDLKERIIAFAPGIHIPLKPFLGIMGVAPKDPGPHSTGPPGPHGGNIDLADLVEGTTLYLPIWLDGANFSTGDAHACQGDGELCLTALETAMDRVRLRFTVLDDEPIERPYAETADHWITMGIDPDLLIASRQAVRDMIRLLGNCYDVPPADAYGLCSMAVDLAITQLVNGNRGVHAKLPKSLFS